MVSRAQHCAAVDAVAAAATDLPAHSTSSVHAHNQTQSQVKHQLHGKGRGGHGDGAHLDSHGNTTAHTVCCTPAGVHQDGSQFISSRSSTPPALTLAHFEAAVDGFTPASLRGVRDSLCHGFCEDVIVTSMDHRFFLHITSPLDANTKK